MNKHLIIADKNKLSQYIKNYLLKNIKNLDLNLKFHEVVIVIGGDGFMLQTLKKYVGSNTYFYGINSGNYGFLMNRFSKKNFFKSIRKLKLIEISPLLMKAKNTKNKITKSFAINEVSIFRQSKQTASLSIDVGNKKLIKRLSSDGVIISTPAGSTGYNLSVHGPILNLNSKKISVVPISPFRPRRWKGKILSDKSKILVKNLSHKKRPVSAVADNYEVRNVKSLFVNSNKKIRFKLLYNSNRSLEKKIKLEQIKKDTR